MCCVCGVILPHRLCIKLTLAVNGLTAVHACFCLYSTDIKLRLFVGSLLYYVMSVTFT